MKVAPTLDGGLRIDAEGLRDWEILRMIVPDAVAQGRDLAARLADGMANGDADDDWRELVEPELRSLFDSQLAKVARAVETAASDCHDTAGCVTIARADAETW